MSETTAATNAADLKPPGLGRRVVESFKVCQTIGGAVLGATFGLRKPNPVGIYQPLGAHHSLGDKSLYYNLGYWKQAKTYDEAAQALAELLGTAADLKTGDQVVDAGFGFGDQDFYWLERFQLGRVFGINITPVHVEVARRRMAERDLADRIDFALGSATELPYADASMDKVVALESAFHFDTREDFFREAYRVLRPGGRIATADIIFEPPAPTQPWSQRMLARIISSYWQIPKANIHDVGEYAEKLKRAGFVDVQIESIFDFVYVQHSEYCFSSEEFESSRSRFNPILVAVWKLGAEAVTKGGSRAIGDYVIVSARKPDA